MKTNAELDKWSAEKCGVTECDDGNGYFFDGKNYQFYEWTLSDARCREIVREHFDLTTARQYHSAINECWATWGEFLIKSPYLRTGKTIEAAEIACIQAIKDAEVNDGNRRN